MLLCPSGVELILHDELLCAFRGQKGSTRCELQRLN